MQVKQNIGSTETFCDPCRFVAHLFNDFCPKFCEFSITHVFGRGAEVSHPAIFLETQKHGHDNNPKIKRESVKRVQILRNAAVTAFLCFRAPNSHHLLNTKMYTSFSVLEPTLQRQQSLISKPQNR